MSRLWGFVSGPAQKRISEIDEDVLIGVYTEDAIVLIGAAYFGKPRI